MVRDGWKNQSLGDLLSLEYGDGLPQTERTGHGYAVYGSSGVIGEHSDYLIEGPGIIVGRKGTVGAIKWSQNNFWPIDTTYYVYPTEELGLRWLYWLLLHSRLDRLDASTGVPGLNRYEAYALSVLVPPLPEQRRIAEILDAADEAIRQTERVIAKLREVKRGLLHDLLTRGLDADGNLRDPVAHPEQFKDSALGSIPRGWEVVELEAIADDEPHAIVDGPFGSNLKSEHYREQGVPVIQSGYVTSGSFVARSYYYVDASLYLDQMRSSVKPGDIVMAKIGAYSGASAILPEGHPVSILASNCLKISANAEICHTGYLLRLLHYYNETGRIELAKTETAQPAISLKNLRRLRISLPSLHEQETIAAVLDAHDARIRAEEAVMAKRRQVKHGLMADLLTGRVRVRL